MNKQILQTLFCSSLVFGLCVDAVKAQEPLLKGGVTKTVGPTVGRTQMPVGAPGTVVPSIGGPALVGPGGQLVGTMSMQGLPKGTMVMPSAMGPLLIGPRGEMRGTLESFGSSLATPAIGMGPRLNFDARPDLGRVRGMYTPTPFPLSGTVTSMSAGEAAPAAAAAGPSIKEYAAARTIPQQQRTRM